MPLPPTHPHGQRRLREIPSWIHDRVMAPKPADSHLQWSDPNSTPVEDFKAWVKFLTEQDSVTGPPPVYRSPEAERFAAGLQKIGEHIRAVPTGIFFDGKEITQYFARANARPPHILDRVTRYIGGKPKHFVVNESGHLSLRDGESPWV